MSKAWVHYIFIALRLSIAVFIGAVWTGICLIVMLLLLAGFERVVQP